MAKTLVYQLWSYAWGDIRLMTAFLSRIAALGCDYVWLSPIYSSSKHNFGYDVTNHYAIDDSFGTISDFQEFVRTAHALGLKIIMDLIIDSTSVEHVWFRNEPGKYYWSKNPSPQWRNFSDQGPAWQFDEKRKDFYLCTSHPKQADLNWFAGGILNRTLIGTFKEIMRYWLYEQDVDGFRVGSAQSLNKDPTRQNMEFENMLIGSRAALAIGELSNLYGGKTPILMLDMLDPTYGSIVDYYSEKTDVEFITNSILKYSVTSGSGIDEGFKSLIAGHAKNPKYMLELESHESSRFTSASGLEGSQVLDLMFSSPVQAVCLYQGQELGLENPKEKDLPMAEIMRLDPAAATQFENGASAVSIRQTTCANSRTPIPLDEYARQEKNPLSTLNHAKFIIKKWKAL